MAHNLAIRPALTWAPITNLLSTEMAQFDTAQFKSLNADDGGAWNPVAAITIGGAGVQLGGIGTQHHVLINATFACDVGSVFQALGTNTIAGSTGISGAVQTTSGTWHWNNGTTTTVDSGAAWTFATGSSPLSQASFTFLGGVLISAGGSSSITLPTGSALNCQGNTVQSMTGTSVLQFAANTSCNINNGANFNLNAGAIATCGTTLACSGLGRVAIRYVELGDADYSLSIADGSVFIVRNKTVLRNWTIQNTNAVVGDQMTFFCDTGNATPVVTFGANIISADAHFVTGKIDSATFKRIELVYSGTHWERVQAV